MNNPSSIFCFCSLLNYPWDQLPTVFVFMFLCSVLVWLLILLPFWLFVLSAWDSCGYALAGRAVPTTFIYLLRLQRDRYQLPSPTTRKYYEVDVSHPNKQGYLDPYKCCRYHFQDYRIGVGPKAQWRYLTMCTPSNEISSKDVLTFWKCVFLSWRGWLHIPYRLKSSLQLLQLCYIIYIRHEAQRDWLFEKYKSEELIIINRDDEHEKDETLAEFMPSHTTSKMDLFRDSLTSLMQMELEWLQPSDSFLFRLFMDFIFVFSSRCGHFCSIFYF